MKKLLKVLPLLLLLSTALFVQQVQACGASPTARIVSTPNVSIIYSGDQILFSGTTSSANCGSINQYRWQVDGVTKSWSSSYTHTFTLAAGVVEQVFTVQLRVRNTYNKYGYKTIYITVRDNQSLYYITDHLGSVRVTVDEDGEAVTWDDYYPYGKRMAQRTQNVGDNNDDTKYTGYQYEDEGDLNLYHAGARLYDPEIGRFLSRDRFDAKYPSFTPYQYAANNPISFIDVNGDSIWINDSGSRYLYVDGDLFNEDGSEYTGRTRGFLGTTVRALNRIRYSGTSGFGVIAALQGSKNNFDIKNGSNRFKSDDVQAASGTIQELMGNPYFKSGGSGGDISWDPGYSGTYELGSNSLVSRPAMMLAHELFHGYEADQGVLDPTPINNDLQRSEWRAVYFENQVRNDLHVPYRTYYRRSVDTSGRPIGGAAPRMLDRNNNPIHIMPAVVTMKLKMPIVKYQ